MSKQVIQIKGEIVKGNGRSLEDLDELINKIGIKLYPGSLNLVLKDPIFLEVNQSDIVFGNNNNRYIWKAKIKDFPEIECVYVYRWNGSPLHIIEVISDEMIRQHLKKEQKLLTVEIDKKSLRPLSWFGKIIWKFTWYKRENWYYKNKWYRKNILKWFRIFDLLSAQRDRFVF